jgi:hypothetical protein
MITKLMSLALIASVLVGISANKSMADCVDNAKSIDGFKIVDVHTILLLRGGSPAVTIKTDNFIAPDITLTVVKDHFCSFDTSAVLINDTLTAVTEVTAVQQ